MDSQKILILLRKNEGPKLDFKAKIDFETESGKKELAKDVIAIANSPGGRGYIVIGIEDKTKKILGIDPEAYSEERIQQIVGNRCDPPLNVRYETVLVNGLPVGVITVFLSLKRPHQMWQTGAFYIRRGSTTDFARRDEIAAMLQQGGIIHNEQIPVVNLTQEVLDWQSIRSYLNRMNYPIPEVDPEPLYSNLGLLSYDREEERYHPTIGALLLFCPDLQRYMPHAGIRIVNWLGGARQEVWVEGTLIQMLDRSLEAIREMVGDDYPLEAVEETVANALVHRDYFDYDREIMIYIGHKRIEISNPGCVHGKEALDNLTKENNPFRRNTWLYHQLMIMDPHSRFTKYGLGLEKVKKVLEGRGRARFINLQKINMFKVVLPGVSAGKNPVKKPAQP